MRESLSQPLSFRVLWKVIIAIVFELLFVTKENSFSSFVGSNPRNEPSSKVSSSFINKLSKVDFKPSNSWPNI